MPTDRFWILIARKLSGESSVEEDRELESLLKQHPNLHFSVEIITNIWKRNAKKDDKVLENSYDFHIDRMKNLGIPLQSDGIGDQDANSPFLIHASRRPRFKYALLLTTAIVLLAGSALFFIFLANHKTPGKSTDTVDLAVTTKFGSRTNLQLPDGSKVWLNAGSTLTYDKQFGEQIREVKLSGEAYFDVVKNVEKPFIIHTTNMDIKVLGTEFNVKSYTNDKLSEASLIRGSIEVFLKRGDLKKILLKPNEKIVVWNEEQEKKIATPTAKPGISEPKVEKLSYASVDSTIIETSWVENKLIFRNESFEDIAIRMERWYGTPVVIDEALKDIHLTGAFKNETIEQALHAFQLMEGFKYAIRNNTVYITKK